MEVGWILGEPVAVADLSAVGFRFAFTLFLAGALEEFGWRGFLQPRLQEQRSALFAAVIIGIIWALWHAPLTIRGTGAGYKSGEITGHLIGFPLGIILYSGRTYLAATRPEPPIPWKSHSHHDS